MMQRRPNPLYSPLGCGSAVVLVLFLSAYLFFIGPSLFSPGKLSAAGSGETSIEGYTTHADFDQQCQLCHSGWRGVSPALCVHCHSDIELERETGTGLHGRLTDTGRCIDCHTDHNGPDAGVTLLTVNGFQHDSLTSFSLVHHEKNYDGEPISCSDCHLAGRYRADTVDCIACHDSGDPSFTQNHLSLFGAVCLDCHDGQDSMSTFDHNAIFALEGAHDEVSCDGCHNQQLSSTLTGDCVDCHAEPEVHFGIFGIDCVRCHTASAWIPAQLTQHTFPLDHGEQGKNECQTCHVASYAEYTCYSCHEHDRREIIEEHEDEGITLIDDCVSCHPTGQEDEA
jgi:hypothetical protein